MNTNLLHALHKTYQDLQDELVAVKKMIVEERIRVCKETTGLKVGALIKDKDGLIYRVFELRFDDSFELTGKPCSVQAHRLQYDGAIIKWLSILTVDDDGLQVLS